MNVASLTNEQILTLAPEKTVLLAAQRTAVTARWSKLGANKKQIWGIYTNRKNHFVVQVAQEDLHMACSCPAQKKPCPHVLSLLLHYKAQPAAFTTHALPSWATDLTAAALPTTKPLATPQKLLARMIAGLTEFELWLQDMVRSGLAALPERPRAYWDQMVNRLVDAQLPRLAHELQHLARLPKQHGSWVDYLLRELGRIYLIIQTGKQYATLPPAVQNDFRLAVGWFPRRIPNGATAVVDDWLVVGQTNTPLGRALWRRTWLWGSNTNRPALICQMVSPQSAIHPGPFALRTFVSGTRVSGTMHLLPGQIPLLALPGNVTTISQNDRGPFGTDSIPEAVRGFSQALSQNPFCQLFPFALQSVMPARVEGQWIIRDQDGYQLPLPAGFLAGWHLLAFCQPTLSIFGEWNGRLFTPLTFWAGNRWLDLRVIKGIP